MKNILKISTLFILIACGSKHSEDVEKVEVLQARLASLENTFHSVSVDDVKEAREAYNDNMRKVKTYYFSDTIDREFTSLLNSYKGIKNSTGNLEFDYQSNMTNIDFMKKQLEDLHTDIENNVLPKDSIAIFIQQESLNLEQLSENVGNYVINADYAIGLHDSLSHKIAEYMKPYEANF